MNRLILCIVLPFGILLSGCKSSKGPTGIDYSRLAPAFQKLTYAEKAQVALAQEIYFDWGTYSGGDFLARVDGYSQNVTLDYFLLSQSEGSPQSTGERHPPKAGTDGLERVLDFTGARINLLSFFSGDYYTYDEIRDRDALNGYHLPILDGPRSLELICDRMFNLSFGNGGGNTNRDHLSLCSGSEFDGYTQLRRTMNTVAMHGSIQAELIPTYIDEYNGTGMRGIIVQDEWELGDWTISFANPHPLLVTDPTLRNTEEDAIVTWNRHLFPIPLVGILRTGFVYNIYRNQ